MCCKAAERRLFLFGAKREQAGVKKINYQWMFFEGRNSQTIISSSDSRKTTVYFSVIGNTFVADRGAFRVTADCMRPTDIGKLLEEIINLGGKFFGCCNESL
jgi:hypothetical protein